MLMCCIEETCTTSSKRTNPSTALKYCDFIPSLDMSVIYCSLCLKLSSTLRIHICIDWKYLSPYRRQARTVSVTYINIFGKGGRNEKKSYHVLHLSCRLLRMSFFCSGCCEALYILFSETLNIKTKNSTSPCRNVASLYILQCRSRHERLPCSRRDMRMFPLTTGGALKLLQQKRLGVPELKKRTIPVIKISLQTCLQQCSLLEHGYTHLELFG